MRYCILFLTVIIINYCDGMDLPELSQKIIFLNGTTTAGKSFIAAELKARLEARSLSVEVLAIDTFLVPKVQWLLATKRLNPLNFFVESIDLITPSDVEAIGKESQTELCSAARAAYEQGKIVIIDAPIYRSDRVACYQESLGGLKVAWTLVYCPVATLVERVISRNEKSGITGQRSIVQALDQFNHMYSSRDTQFVDTLSQNILYATFDRAQKQHAIMQNRIPDFLKSIQRAICPFDFDTLQRSMFEKLSFDDNMESKIGPVIQHDCIVNTALHDSASCAQMIMERIFNVSF